MIETTATKVVSFSGGKDSTAMLLMMIEKSIPFDHIIFIDTTKEFPDMYKHIEKIKTIIYPLEIETIKLDYDYWLGDHIKTRGKNKGKKGYGFPDIKNRWCTSLKRRLLTKTMKEKVGKGKIIEFEGIALDEKDRKYKNSYYKNLKWEIKYPLIDWEITQQQALDYCYSKGLTWEGLYEKFTRVSCWCCPLKSQKDFYSIYHHYPDLWQKLKQMEEKSFRKFRSDYSVEELEDKFTPNLNTK
jgi:3'-phosphoadenosine 5'-phosphosulfate sulfotransferase (PAPS reductase)/FAD synthetase